MKSSVLPSLAALVVGSSLLACHDKTSAEPAPLPAEVVVPMPSHSGAGRANAPVPAPAASADSHGGNRRQRVVLEEIGVPSAPSEVSVHWKIPQGTSVNDEAPFRIRWKSSEALENAPDDIAAKGAGHEHGFRIALRPAKGAKVARLLGEVELVVCDAESHSVCRPVKREVDLSFVVGGGNAPKPVELQLPAAHG